MQMQEGAEVGGMKSARAAANTLGVQTLVFDPAHHCIAGDVQQGCHLLRGQLERVGWLG